MAATEWFTTCINFLKTNNANIGNRYEENSLLNDLNYRTSTGGNTTIRRIALYNELDPCNPSDLNSHKCALFTPVKEDKIVPKEFYFEPKSSSNPVGSHYTDLYNKECKFQEKYA